VRGDGGSITLPTPGHQYHWDPVCNLDTVPLRRAPSWLAHRARAGHDRAPPSLQPDEVLLRACREIRSAANGERHHVLNRQSFIIGCLVARGALDQGRALHELQAATATMVWGTAANQRKAAADLNDAFKAGLRSR